MSRKRNSKRDWKSVFTRSHDSEDGLPRFYVRGSRRELMGYNGYMGTHRRLNEILDFLGGNEPYYWTSSDSPFNVASYECRCHYLDGPEDAPDRIEIFAGNYLCSGNPQGAWVVGFTLFRALIGHLGLKSPRRLKGEPAAG
jgi:hypothetical protein